MASARQQLKAEEHSCAMHGCGHAASETEVTGALIEEHKEIIKIADALDSEVRQLNKGKPVDKAFFAEAVNFIRSYADRFHHAKEEDILFKELCKPELEMHCNPVDQMLFEHEKGREAVKLMEAGAKSGNKKQAIEGAQAYAELIRDHIFKEDNILYPMAESVLNDAAKRKMTAAFAEAEAKQPKGTKERCLKIAIKLAARKQ